MKSNKSNMSSHCGSSCSADGKRIVIREQCGLEHRFQVITAVVPDDALPEVFRVCDLKSGRYFCGQRSVEDRNAAFVAIELAAGAELELEFTVEPPEFTGNQVKFSEGAEFLTMDNGVLGVKIPVQQKSDGNPCSLSGPVVALRHGGGSWFGGTYFDTIMPIGGSSTRIVESGPVRSVVEFTTSGQEYAVRMRLDIGQNFMEMDEEFQSFEGDQLVWMFAGCDLPEYGYFLNTTPWYETRLLTYALDGELARLGPWSQQSQLALSDGFAFLRPESDTIFGAVAFDGGSWRGNRLNSLDAAMRRLRNGDRRTRRLVHSYAKADMITGPGSEHIPARDRRECDGVLCWEGWLGKGRRKWGLAVFTPQEFRPANEAVEPLSHFEDHATLEMCREQQGALRKLHIENVFSLQQQLEYVFESTVKPVTGWSFSSNADFMHEIIAPGEPDAILDDEKFLRRMSEFLDSRVISFWYGAGIISTNPVSSRRVAPYLFLLEELAAAGKVPEALLHKLRTRGLFLAALFHRQSYYAGHSAMLPADDPDSLDPTLQGMMNQNFYTDVINLHGVAGLLYPDNPRAGNWIETFVEMFSRQLDFHVYPNSGVWEESHTYFQHVLLTVLPVMIMLRDKGGYDFFGDVRLQKMLQAAIAQISPRDALTGGFRHLTAFGDHLASITPYKVMWSAFAAMVAPHDRTLAGNLNFLAAETGGKPDTAIAITAPPWRSCHLEGLGVFFRSYAGDGSETMFALRCGKAWGHHHCDDSSFQLFSAGRLLIGDAGFGGGGAGQLKFLDTGHSRWTIPGKHILNYHWKFNRGWITEYTPEYASCCTPAYLENIQGLDRLISQPIRHFRSVIQVSGNEFILIDSNLEPTESLYNFHLASTDVVADGMDAVKAVYGGIELQLRSLTGNQPVIGDVIKGDSDLETVPVCFEAEKRQPYTAFLIRFGSSLPPAILPEIRFENGLIQIQKIKLRHIPQK